VLKYYTEMSLFDSQITAALDRPILVTTYVCMPHVRTAYVTPSPSQLTIRLAIKLSCYMHVVRRFRHRRQ